MPPSRRPPVGTLYVYGVSVCVCVVTEDGDPDHSQSAERAWERLVSAHRFGDCLITIATGGKLTEEEQQATGLVSGHAYAVLDVREGWSRTS